MDRCKGLRTIHLAIPERLRSSVSDGARSLDSHWRFRMSLTEKMLLCFTAPDVPPPGTDSCGPVDVERALDELRHCFPGLSKMIQGRRVLDFGSGYGRQAVALAQQGAAEVVGVEISERGLDSGRMLADAHGVSERTRFVREIGAAERGRFDVCISLNSMEHFSEPLRMLQLMRSSLTPGGVLLVTFAPPWYAPYGGHMTYITRMPWVHLVFPERTVMRIRSRYRSDGAMRYEDVEGGLNKMSLSRFERLVREAGLQPVRTHYEAVKRLPFVTRIPVLRELLTNRVTAVLRPA
jgi:SAM-dependent methyltransferase